MVHGFSCAQCGYRLAAERPVCPICRSAIEPREFGPGGVVWSATVVRVGVPDRATPLGLAYVDLDDGPRVLCHFGGDAPDALLAALAPGSRVELAGLTQLGDPQVRVV